MAEEAENLAPTNYATERRKALPPQDDAFTLQDVEERLSELRTIKAMARVSAREECPVCLQHFEEQTFPRARVPRDGFECSHSICYDCSWRLLKQTDAPYRCPLCRAAGVGKEASPPGWLKDQMASPEVVAAREAAMRLVEEQAPDGIRRATMTAVQQIEALMRVMDGDPDFDRMRQAVQAASAVAVRISEEGEEGADADAIFDGVEGGRATFGVGLTSDELQRQLQAEMAAEVEMGHASWRSGGANDETASWSGGDGESGDDDADEAPPPLGHPRMNGFMAAVARAL